ncbi:MAG: NAD-dependent DNA ligase LigA [Methanomassiliicoccales archaeon]|jgi:DNA ligase (NAD+)
MATTTHKAVDTSKSIDERFAFLRECNALYETTGKSTISDPEYDQECAVLLKLDPTNEFWDEVGGRDEEHIYGTSAKHAVIMGSLNKSHTIEEFEAWMRSAYPPDAILTFVVEHKVDGTSLGCTYDGGELTRVLTRGDGEKGVDVTKNASYVEGIPQKIPCKDLLEVRGECYKNRFDFFARWAGEYANPRNFTAGSLNQKDAKVTKDRGLSFVAYEVVRKEFTTETDKIKFIRSQGFADFSTVSPKSILRVTGKISHIVMEVEKYMKSIRRDKLPYQIDGVVAKLDDINKSKAMGTTNEGKKPKANRAVKFPAEQKQTDLLGIEWNIGRTGGLAPVGLLTPVQLDGSVVKRVSLHNLKFIKENDLSIGCKVLLQKSGDIIPYVVRKTMDGNKPIVIPDVCPSCGEKLEWDATQTTKFCTNTVCIAQLNANIDHWCKKLDIKGIGSGIIERLTSKKVSSTYRAREGFVVECLSDMYCLDRFQGILENEFGDRAFEKIQESMASVKSVTLAKFIEALGIGKVGTMAKDIVGIAPTLDDIDALTVDDMLKIQGFAEIKAKSFLKGWKSMRKEISMLLDNHIKIEKQAYASQKLAGKSFCFTGSFSNPTRGEMEKMIVDNGGKLSSVSKNLTSLVWDGEMTGSKYDKAQKLNIPVISQKDFLKIMA